MIDWKIWEGCMHCSPDCNYCMIHEKHLTKYSDKFKLSIDDSNKPVQFEEDRILLHGVHFKYPSKTIFSVCPTSDFFLGEADTFRYKYWNMMKVRFDCLFLIVTSRPSRIKECLPDDWGDGLNNVIIGVKGSTQKNLQKSYNEVRDLPLRHISLMLHPIVEKIDITTLGLKENVQFISSQGDYVKGAESDFSWHKKLSEDSKKLGIGYVFNATGTRFRVGEKIYNIPLNKMEMQASKANINVCKKVDITGVAEKYMIM